MGFFSLPDFSITIGPPPKKATKKSNPQFLDEIAKQPTNDCWKYYGTNIWMRRCKNPKTNHPFWMFGVTRDNDAEPTTNTYTCNLMPRKQPFDFDHLLQIHNDILRELVWHREQAKCDCDFGWMVRQKTEQKTLRLCFSPNIRALMREMMDEHDELCSCGCFGTSKDEQSREII